MGYYDSVKDDVKEGSKGGSSNAPNFDTLKRAAEETSGEEEQPDDTPIEVLEEGGLNRQNTNQNRNQQQSQESRPVQQSSTDSDIDISSLENKLDRIIEQNDRMIEILESFGS